MYLCWGILRNYYNFAHLHIPAALAVSLKVQTVEVLGSVSQDIPNADDVIIADFVTLLRPISLVLY